MVVDPDGKIRRVPLFIVTAAARVPNLGFRVAADRLGLPLLNAFPTADGIVFGDDPRHGYFRETAFYHPEMKFQLDFPREWKLANARQYVAGSSTRSIRAGTASGVFLFASSTVAW